MYVAVHKGIPKVFYHGTRESIGNKEILTPKHTDDTGRNYPARFFSSSHNVALSYTKELPNSDNGIYKVFLNAKNPLVIDFQGKDFVDRSELADKIYKGEQYFDLAIRKALDEAKESGKPFDSVIYKNVRDERYGRSKEISDTIAIFNPNQIKHIDNKGSYTDTQGNITKTKPKNKESTHTYFNDKSPNIMYANPKHLGIGFLSGTAAGIETDENGNIVGFNPQNFVLGLIGGSVASRAVSKLYNNESTQRYATLAIKSIQQDYKSLSENNPAMFAKIMQKFNPRDFLKGKKEIKSLSNEIFNKELAKAIESALQNGKVETMPQAEFRNKEEFAKMFDSINGNKGIIETPYKEVKADIKSAWRHFKHNTNGADRENIKGGFFKTFKDPLFIVEQAREGQSSPSVYFYKPFYDNDKKLMNLFGIGIDSVGNIDFKTYYFDEKETRLNAILKSEKIKIVYMQE